MQPNPHQVRATATFKTHTSPLGAKGKDRLHFGSLLVLQLDVWHSIANIHSHPEDAAPQTSNIQFYTTGIKCELTEALFSQMYLYVTGKLQLLKAFSPPLPKSAQLAPELSYLIRLDLLFSKK